MWCRTYLPWLWVGTQAPGRKTGVVKGHASGSKGAEPFSTSGQGLGTMVGRWASWHMTTMAGLQHHPHPHPGAVTGLLSASTATGLGGVIQETGQAHDYSVVVNYKA